MTKLVAIGDSLTQAVMSAAVARTDLSFATLIAGALGASDYNYPTWPKGGLPANIETILRDLETLFGSTIAGPLEWIGTFARIGFLLDRIEHYYERGPGRADLPDPSGAIAFRNLACSGFRVADAWLVTPALCRQIIRDSPGGGNDAFAVPSAWFYRAALNVLNPSRDPQFDEFNQLSWLERFCAEPDGVENLVLWLGANNALGTVTRLEIHPTETAHPPLGLTQPERLRYNLWRPDHFRAEFDVLVDSVDQIMRQNQTANWQVFVATIPAVTVAAIAHGVGNAQHEQDPFNCLSQATYFDFYTYVTFDEGYIRRGGAHLTHAQALLIDRHVAEYNRAIGDALDRLNACYPAPHYHLVDINRALLQLAYRRNDGNPTYPLPEPVRQLDPIPDTRFYLATRDRRVEQGGLLSLDGVHPSAIGQGIIADEFLRVMADAGVGPLIPLDWDSIIAGDSLYTQPVPLIREPFRNARVFEWLVERLRRS